MPPKKAKAPAVQSLQGYAIAIGTNTIPKGLLGGKSLTDVKDEIGVNGGSYVTKVHECTHLVVTEAQYSKPVGKVDEAKTDPNIHIVSYEWLEKSLSAIAPVDSSIYSYRNQSSSVKDTTTDTHAKSTKASDGGQNDTSDDQAPSKKRKRDSDVDGAQKKIATGDEKAMNVTKQLDMKIPLDEGFASAFGTKFTVHIDEDSVIYDVTLNQTNSGANANKFYRMQLWHDGMGRWYTPTRWGRVGETGQLKMAADATTYNNALAEFKKKFKDKTGNSWEERSTGSIKKGKYAFIERSYEDTDTEGENELPGAEKRKEEDNKDAKPDKEMYESKLPEPVQRLLKLIFNQDNFQSVFDDLQYDAKKMPLGKLSKNSLMRGYAVLKELASLVGNSGDHDDIQDLSNQYLSLVPHVISRSQRPPVLDHMDKIKRELELLEALTDMQIANDLIKKSSQSKEEVNLLDQQYEKLGMQEMEPVKAGTEEYMQLESYLTKSVGHTHGTRYKVQVSIPVNPQEGPNQHTFRPLTQYVRVNIEQDIFRIERNGEHERFDNSEYAKVPNKNRRLLWHGSRATNFGGILSQGLRIAPPEAPVSGYMFGKGVYLADMSSKSANYCCAGSSGGTGLLLLCEAELGEPPLKLTDADYNAGDRVKQENCLSTLGMGRTTPQAWKDASCLHPSLKGVSMPDVVSVKPGPNRAGGQWLQYNEYIVYDVAQIKLRYLFRVQM
ncbi:hypothetical protein LTS08_006160 [Lithohypha guttulata]|uniref:uncharacterized protein n=1 Tax=Lithohypha guttulata TaxID=1690604 RepID=UPI002DDF676C|nr:hypothetical protein LTR51_002837 [Lithohypha guttulata]KAK5098782.1 hypothetical protein LTS08_006160 [Lithohypha guttulata]